MHGSYEQNAGRGEYADYFFQDFEECVEQSERTDFFGRRGFHAAVICLFVKI